MNDNPHSKHLDLETQAVVADALLANDLGSIDASVAQHLESCHDCRKAVMELADITSVMEGVKVPTEPVVVNATGSRGSVIRWVAIAASVALLIVVGVLWNENAELNERLTTSDEEEVKSTMPEPQPEEEVVVQEVEEESPDEEAVSVETENEVLHALVEEQEKVISKAFEPNPVFEDQLALAVRSGGGGSAAPREGTFTGSQTIEFTWDDADARLAILVYNNRGLMIQQFLDVKSGHELEAAQLTPGTYYWKLAGETDVYFLGKFTIDKPPIP